MKKILGRKVHYFKQILTVLFLILIAAAVEAQTAIISTPTQNQVLSNFYMSGGTNINVIGTATGPGMANWILDYGSGAAPTTWTTISTGTTDVNNAPLGTWNTKPSGTLLANGTWTLRLRVRNSSNQTIAEAQRQVNLQHFKVGQSLTQFNAASGTQLTYSSTVPCLTTPCTNTQMTETLWIKNETGTTVRTLVNAVPRAAGTFNDNWNGTKDSGTLLPDGAYFYMASVTNGTYSMTWDLTNEFLTGNCIAAFGTGFIDYTPFDPYDNIPLTFTYNFTRTGRITIKFWPCGTTYVGCTEPTCPGSYTLVNSKYEETGPHTVRWASTDGTGAYKKLPWGKVLNKVDSFSKNAVVLFGTKPVISNFKVLPPVFNPMRGTQEIKFDLNVYSYQSQNANITISIINQKSSPPSVLRTFNTTSGTGPVSIVWNGKDNQNDKWLAQSSYTIRASITDSVIGNQITEDIVMSIQY